LMLRCSPDTVKGYQSRRDEEEEALMFALSKLLICVFIGAVHHGLRASTW
jgi:hypothetical protein